MFSSSSSIELLCSFDHTMHESFDSFQFIVRLEQKQSVEVSISRMTDNRSDNTRCVDVLLRFCDQFREFGQRDTCVRAESVSFE